MADFASLVGQIVGQYQPDELLGKDGITSEEFRL